MIEEMLAVESLKKPLKALGLGFGYVIVGFLLTQIFFHEAFSTAMLLIVAMLLVPSILRIIEIEEKRDRKLGTKDFLKNHVGVFVSFFFLALGVFFGYLVLGALAHKGLFVDVNYNNFFGLQLHAIFGTADFSTDQLNSIMETGQLVPGRHLLATLVTNIGVAFACFILSVIFGYGAMFLIVLNASGFAAFVVFVARFMAAEYSQRLLVIASFLPHLIPEIAGFILAAIGGALLSKATVAETFGSQEFVNVLKDATIMFGLGIALIFLASFIEIWISVPLVRLTLGL